jgi:hypothetical protein
MPVIIELLAAEGAGSRRGRSRRRNNRRRRSDQFSLDGDSSRLSAVGTRSHASQPTRIVLSRSPVAHKLINSLSRDNPSKTRSGVKPGCLLIIYIISVQGCSKICFNCPFGNYLPPSMCFNDLNTR